MQTAGSIPPLRTSPYSAVPRPHKVARNVGVKAAVSIDIGGTEGE